METLSTLEKQHYQNLLSMNLSTLSFIFTLSVIFMYKLFSLQDYWTIAYYFLYICFLYLYIYVYIYIYMVVGLMMSIYIICNTMCVYINIYIVYIYVNIYMYMYHLYTVMNMHNAYVYKWNIWIISHEILDNWYIDQCVSTVIILMPCIHSIVKVKI